MSVGQGVSLRPETFDEPSGLFDDIDVIIKDPAAALDDFRGALAEPVPVLRFTMESCETGAEQVALLSVGGGNRLWAPSDCGKFFFSLKDETKAMKRKTKFAMFMESLVNAGVYDFIPDLGADVTALEGLKVHIVRQVKKKDDGKEDSQIIVTKVHGFGDEASAGKAKPASGTKGAKPAAKAQAKASKKDVSGEAVSFVTEITLTMLGEGPKTRQEIGQAIMRNTAIEPEMRNACLALAFNAAFMTDAERPWSSDGDTLSTVPF